MTNPILTALGSQSRVRQMFDMVKSSKNPQQMVMNMMSQNPQMKPVIDTLKSGGNPKAMFYQVCKSKGIDPEQILSMMK